MTREKLTPLQRKILVVMADEPDGRARFQSGLRSRAWDMTRDLNKTIVFRGAQHPQFYLANRGLLTALGGEYYSITQAGREAVRGGENAPHNQERRDSGEPSR